jgi:hypothetical protein
MDGVASNAMAVYYGLAIVFVRDRALCQEPTAPPSVFWVSLTQLRTCSNLLAFGGPYLSHRCFSGRAWLRLRVVLNRLETIGYDDHSRLGSVILSPW